MALGPGLVLAEVAGSRFCPLTPSRRLRLFAPPALPAAATRQCPVRSCVVAGRWTAATRRGGGTHLLARTIASDATYSAAGKRVGSGGLAASSAKRSLIAYAVARRETRFPASSSWFAEAGASCRRSVHSGRRLTPSAKRSLSRVVELARGSRVGRLARAI